MTTGVAHWEHFAHQAEVGVRGVGETLDQAFEQVGLALTAVITDPSAVHPTQAVVIECEATRASLLLENWLSQLALEMDTRHMVFGRFEVHLGPPDLGGALSLYALVWGEAVDPELHPPVVVKGATYDDLEITQDELGHWVAQCVVEI